MIINKLAGNGPSRRPAQVSKFLKSQTCKGHYCQINFSLPKNTPRDTHKTRNPLSPPENTKKTFFENYFLQSFCWG